MLLADAVQLVVKLSTIAECAMSCRNLPDNLLCFCKDVERLSRREQDADAFIAKLEALETTHLKQATAGTDPDVEDCTKAMVSMINQLLYEGYEMWAGKICPLSNF